MIVGFRKIQRIIIQLFMSPEKAWKQLSSELDGRFIEDGTGNFANVQVDHKKWTILLDTFDEVIGRIPVTFTRIRVLCKKKEDLYFKIYRKAFVGIPLKFGGCTDIKTEDDDFDRLFSIIGDNEEKIINLLNSTIISLLKGMSPYSDITIELNSRKGAYNRHLPADVFELHLKITPVINDTERLKALFSLITEMLEQLCALEAVGSDKPSEVTIS